MSTTMAVPSNKLVAKTSPKPGFQRMPGEIRNAIYQLIADEPEKIRAKFGPVWYFNPVKNAGSIIVHIEDFRIDIRKLVDALPKPVEGTKLSVTISIILTQEHEEYDLDGSLEYFCHQITEGWRSSQADLNLAIRHKNSHYELRRLRAWLCRVTIRGSTESPDSDIIDYEGSHREFYGVVRQIKHALARGKAWFW